MPRRYCQFVPGHREVVVAQDVMLVEREAIEDRKDGVEIGALGIDQVAELDRERRSFSAIERRDRVLQLPSDFR